MAKKNITEEKLPSKADVTKIIMMHNFLESAYAEMKDFSKKNPDTVLNERKVKSLNKILNDIKDILVNEPTAEYLDLLDEDMLPTNSDVVLAMSQYHSAMDNFRNKYRKYSSLDYNHYWHTSEGKVLAKEFEGDHPRWV